MFSLPLITLFVAASQATARPSREGSWLQARGEEPAFDTDEGAPEDCTFWYDSAETRECSVLTNAFSITTEDLVAWNPSLESSCEIQPYHSYCVEVPSETAPEPSESETPSPTGGNDDEATGTPTSPDEEDQTPENVQNGIAENCDAFYLVESGDSCTEIAAANGISLGDLVEWNPDIGEDCTNMWADYYLCVSIEGHEPSDGEDSTEDDDPTPTQPGTVEECDEFHLVEEGDICGEIIKEYDISLDEFLEWNTDVGGRACTGLWLGYNVCVGVAD